LRSADTIRSAWLGPVAFKIQIRLFRSGGSNCFFYSRKRKQPRRTTMSGKSFRRMHLISGKAEITSLLRAWGSGDDGALDRLTVLLHDELRRMARYYAHRERPEDALQPTELLNEAYLRLLETKDTNWQDRSHFFAVSAQIMRRILVDAARTRTSRKRGGEVK